MKRCLPAAGMDGERTVWICARGNAADARHACRIVPTRNAGMTAVMVTAGIASPVIDARIIIA